MTKCVFQGARLLALLAVASLIPVGASANTIAQNSAWNVTRPGSTPSQTVRIVAYGDSIFAGYTNATTIARRGGPHVAGEYTAALLGQNVEIRRRCQSGGVAADIYGRINSTTDRAFMQDAKTRIVMFEMCGNDYLQARSNFKGASGTCSYTGLNTALNNCKNYTQLAMNNINQYAHANTRLKIVMNLYYPGYDADNAYSSCTDPVNGDPANGNRVHMRTLFLPRIAESNWWTCKYAEDKGFACADMFANYMARDYDWNGDGVIDSDALRYRRGESLNSYRSRILSLSNTLRDSNFKLVNATTSYDYLLSDDTHATYEGATAGTLFTTPGGDVSVFHATSGPYPNGKNPNWNKNGHDRMGWGVNPTGVFAPASCGNGAIETEWLPSGEPSPEECDDANLVDGDGCDSTCTVETGYSCSGSPSLCAPVCGDGFVTGPEQCDDGNTAAGDGCSATCTVEPGFLCSGTSPSTCVNICGDGYVVAGEGCDDGNLDAEDGCSSVCMVEEGWSCSGETSVCAPICGDELIRGTETCDEGAETGIFPSCCSLSCSPEPSGTPCDDGVPCTINDVCDGELGCSGTPNTCDDGNPCTDDSCDPETGGCINTNNTASCDDGNACTINDVCSGGTCGGATLDCNDSNVCTDDSCDPETGCVNDANTDPCDDGNACTTNDTCDDKVCVGGAPPDCEDGNVCTDDSCNPATGCVNTNNTAPCSDGNACTAPDVCSAGSCVSGPPVYGFNGFFQPVDNPPVVNLGKAGQTFPIKWQLPLCSGGYVSRLDALLHNPPRYRKVACDNSAPIESMPADTSGQSGLRYDADSDQYHFNWKTNGVLVNSCYELLIELDNGTTQIARFKFNK